MSESRLTSQHLLTGSGQPPPEQQPLRAGPLSLVFDAGDLRYIRLGGREVIRRIYAAVRDRNWGTIPSVISDLETDIAQERFHIRYTSTHRQGEIHFVWRADLVGEPDGSIRFSFDGEARSTFLRNRIGLCVLHPIRECAGTKCRAHHMDGTERELTFPGTIAAEQPIRGLCNLAGLAHEVEPGVWAGLLFAGEVFETEDQRNWIDASFKTYGTPLRLPYPVEIKAGTRVKQEVRLKIGDGNGRDRMAAVSGARLSIGRPPPEPATRIMLGGEVRRLPALGLGLPPLSDVPDERSLRRLLALRLAHLRVDVHPDDVRASVQLAGPSSAAAVLGHPIELAVHLDDATGGVSPDACLLALARHLRTARTPLARILVFGPGAGHCSSTEGLRLARSHLGGLGVPIGAGTNADLYQLQLHRPPAGADFICWSMNPQVHAGDNASIAETPEAAAHQVASMQARFPGLPLVVSPVTLRPRFNPVATGPEPPGPPGGSPPQVDPRQLSLFGAAWTLAMLKALAEGGVVSMTFHETTGWRGVMETAGGTPWPEKFPSEPGMVFPLYHVFADAGEFAGGEVVATLSSGPLAVQSLMLRHGPRRRLMLANLQPCAVPVTVPELTGRWRIRRLNAGTVLRALREPEAFRVSGEVLPASAAGLALTLAPHELATLDPA